MDEKIYKYGDNYYDIEEIYDLESRMTVIKRKAFRDCISHNILAQIFRRSNLDKEATIIESIADLEKTKIDKNLSKAESVIYNTKYSFYVTKLFLMTGRFEKFKTSEFSNGGWLLSRLVSLTIGSGYPVCSYNDLSIIDYTALTEDECKAIADNYRRNIRGEELEFYKSAKALEKRK